MPGAAASALRRTPAFLMLLGLAMLGSMSALAADKTSKTPSWGAIASGQGFWGYAFNHSSRASAEQAARSRCDRAAGRAGACELRTQFDRACGALATGNFGEWGAAVAASADAAGKAAAAQCNSHLPTEPCKIVVTTCSGR